MSRTWSTGVMAVLLALAVYGALRMLNVVLYRAGGIGVIIAVLALAYAVMRNRS